MGRRLSTNARTLIFSPAGYLLRRHRSAGLLFVLAGLLVTGCDINSPAGYPTIIVVAPPTNTLAPVITQTQRFTATPLPSLSPIPSATVATLTPTAEPPAVALQPTQTATATPIIKAVINLNANTVNLRAGPGSTFRQVGSLKAGSPVLVISLNADAKWALVRLDDGTEGWINSTFFTLANPSATVPVLAAADLTQRAQLATAIVQTATALVPTAEGGIAIDANAPTRTAKVDRTTDVLAYCDQRADSAKNRKFTQGQKIYLFWSWIAKTPEQMKDHLNNAVYVVKVNGQAIGDWARYSTPVTQQPDKSYITYWFVPLGAPGVGAYKIDFNLTWKAAINDGDRNFGPGTDNAADVGSCAFTVAAK